MRGPAILVALLLNVGLTRPTAAAAQVGREVGVHIVGGTAPRATVVAGPVFAARVGRRDRLALQAGVGVDDESKAVGRIEALWHFHLDPAAIGKPGVYLGGGAGAILGDEARGVVIVTLGVEGSPGGRSGWVAELGVGGGLRIGVGYRWRWPLRE